MGGWITFGLSELGVVLYRYPIMTALNSNHLSLKLRQLRHISKCIILKNGAVPNKPDIQGFAN